MSSLTSSYIYPVMRRARKYTNIHTYIISYKKEIQNQRKFEILTRRTWKRDGVEIEVESLEEEG